MYLRYKEQTQTEKAVKLDGRWLPKSGIRSIYKGEFSGGIVLLEPWAAEKVGVVMGDPEDKELLAKRIFPVPDNKIRRFKNTLNRGWEEYEA